MYKLQSVNVTLIQKITCAFLDELNRGRLHKPTLNMGYFVHIGMILYAKLAESRKRCSVYYRKLLSCIDTPFSRNPAACRTLSNLIFKARVTVDSDRENVLGCLRSKEKLNG